MLKIKIEIIALVLTMLIGLFVTNLAIAQEDSHTKRIEMTPWDEGWAIGAHWGKAFEPSSTWVEFFTPADWELIDYHIISVGLRKKILDYDKYFSINSELSFAHIYGEESYQEVSVTPTISWNLLPWDDYLDTSVSLGFGLSYSSMVTELDETDTKTLISMIFELEFKLPEKDTWSVYTRVHHRSSGADYIGDVISDGGGSNFPSIGLRYHF
ncbi:hypothetical protein GCM10007941_07950 [Amphritea balenae]|nr:hypothetical protein GCM10007941_07950 [Amphritea balenae]